MDRRDKAATIGLPIAIGLSFLLAAAWVGFGRGFFGVLGWFLIFTIFVFAPLILLYGIFLLTTLLIRQRRAVYSLKGPFVITTIIVLVTLFLFGLTLVDGGDTPESIGSAFSAAIGQQTNAAVLAASGTMSVVSALATIAAIIANVVALFAERRIEKRQT